MTRRFVLTCLSLLIGLAILTAGPVSAQRHIEVLPVGQIAVIKDERPATWALAGYTILRLRCTVDGFTPIMRTFLLDARLVEIAWRKNDLLYGGWKEVMAIGPNVVVHVYGTSDNNRGYSHLFMLIKVTPQDAQAAHTSVEALARKWAKSAERALSSVLPSNSVFGG